MKTGGKFTGYPKKCRECGKMFYVLNPEMWVYKRKVGGGGFRFYCSWHCYRAVEKRKEEEKRRKQENMAKVKKKAAEDRTMKDWRSYWVQRRLTELKKFRDTGAVRFETQAYKFEKIVEAFDGYLAWEAEHKDERTDNNIRPCE